MKTLSEHLLYISSNFRNGIVLPFQEVLPTPSELEGFYNISVPEDSVQPWQSASGSLHRSKDKAIIGAIGEAMERYSAAVTEFPLKQLREIEGENYLSYNDFALFYEEQYNNPLFKWKRPDLDAAYFGEVHSLYDNAKVWIPQELIGLGIKKGSAMVPSTSTGLAAHPSPLKAILLALQELLERDALTVYWMNSLGGREIDLDSSYINPVMAKGGCVHCFDITQAWNPHPVIAVCGYLPQRGKKRISMGVACRETQTLAIEKAYAEWIQGAIFAGYYDVYHPGLDLSDITKVADFDEHGVYYTLYPEKWEQVPLLAKRQPHTASPKPDTVAVTAEILEALLESLKEQNIRLFYRDLTIADLRQIGVKVVRVASPELSLIHGDEQSPFLGGRTDDVAWRYPELVSHAQFPNPYPHPLG